MNCPQCGSSAFERGSNSAKWVCRNCGYSEEAAEMPPEHKIVMLEA